MPKGRHGGKDWKPPKMKLGKTNEVKYRHSSLVVQQGKDGSPEAKCPSCEEFIPIRFFWTHKCPKAIVERTNATIRESEEGDEGF